MGTGKAGSTGWTPESVNIIRIVDHGTDLSSRTTGRIIREAALGFAEAGGVVLDFGGVQSISHSFADELAAVLIEQRAKIGSGIMSA